MGTLLSKEQFQELLQEINPYSKFEVLEYTGMAQPVRIHCLECGKIKEYKNGNQAKTQINLCQERHFYSAQQKAEYFAQQYHYKILQWNSEKARYAKLQCLECGAIYYRQHTHLIANPNHCPECKNAAEKQTLTKEQAQSKINEIFGENEYQLLQYTSYHKSALYKHACGFAWKGCYASFLKSRGCPKCFGQKSKGEIAIGKWLKDNQIIFIEQQTLEYPYKRYKFDFYLPDYNLAIEYQGEQHYKDKSKVWEPLNKIQERDAIKRQYCQEHGIELLEIDYKNYDNISQILSSKFND